MFKSKSSFTAAVGVVLLSLGIAGTSAAATVVAARPVAKPAVRVNHRPLPPGITAGEAARIRYQVKEHKQMKRAANADGEITRREQAALARDAAQLRHLIQAAKTN